MFSPLEQFEIVPIIVFPFLVFTSITLRDTSLLVADPLTQFHALGYKRTEISGESHKLCLKTTTYETTIIYEKIAKHRRYKDLTTVPRQAWRVASTTGATPLLPLRRSHINHSVKPSASNKNGIVP